MPEEVQEVPALRVHLEFIAKDVSDIKSALKDIASALVRLALLEERQTHTTTLLDTVAERLEKIHGRVASLEQEQPFNTTFRRGIFGLASIAASAVVAALVAHFF